MSDINLIPEQEELDRQFKNNEISERDYVFKLNDLYKSACQAEEDDLRDCYYSPTQDKLMQLMGCKMKVSLNGKLISQMFKHGTMHDPLDDQVFIGTAKLADIDCVENYY